MRRAVIGLGANLGEREETLAGAIRELRVQPNLCLIRVSSLYVTPPLGPPQPDFLNAAALIETTLDPEALLDVQLGIERLFGRVRDVRWGPRTLDLDLLWMDGVVLETPRIAVPHRGLMERPFALAPLAEVLTEATWATARLAELGGPPPVWRRGWAP